MWDTGTKRARREYNPTLAITCDYGIPIVAIQVRRPRVWLCFGLWLIILHHNLDFRNDNLLKELLHESGNQALPMESWTSEPRSPKP